MEIYHYLDNIDNAKITFNVMISHVNHIIAIITQPY